jgi:Transposase DDE domain
VSTSQKASSWSYKLNAPEQRFQLLSDATGYIRGLWGGYSPKIYDGDWVQLMKYDLAQEYPGSHIIADTHYEKGNQIMKEINVHHAIKFYTPYSKPRGRKRKARPEEDEAALKAKDPSFGLTKLTKEQEVWNPRIAHVRARIETPFGRIKIKWKGLGTVFYDGEIQQTYLFFIAVGAQNFSICEAQADCFP